MKKLLFFIILLIALAAQNAFPMSLQERVDDAHTIINTFTQQYGPLQWKEENLGLDFNMLAEDLIREAGEAATDKDFYQAVAVFLTSLQDAHVSYVIPSSYSARLPFTTLYFKDGVIVRSIDRKNLPANIFPVEEGDLLIAIDEEPVEQIINELSLYDTTGNDASTKKFIGTYYLTYRAQETFPYVPSGPVKLTFLSKKDGSQKDVELEWISEGLDLAEMPPKSATAVMAKAMATPNKRDLRDMSVLIDNDPGKVFPEIQGEQALIGGLMPFFPVWDSFKKRSERPFYTGTFNVGKYIIGYIRINTWSNPGVDNIKIFEDEIRYMNNNTDALVIDQTNNGGGSICYVSEIASFFISEPKNEMRFQLRANRSWLSLYESNYANAGGAEKVHAKMWLDAMRKAVINGDHLSAPVPMCAFSGKVFPKKDEHEMPATYLKPVMILINELDFSAADMFPAIMQDWKVATLFGTKTVGAGGSVVGTSYVGNSELSIRFTRSLAVREGEYPAENGTMTHYIENVGVTPDIEYEVTLKDHYDGYKGYKKTIDDAVISLIEAGK